MRILGGCLDSNDWLEFCIKRVQKPKKQNIAKGILQEFIPKGFPLLGLIISFKHIENPVNTHDRLFYGRKTAYSRCGL